MYQKCIKNVSKSSWSGERVEERKASKKGWKKGIQKGKSQRIPKSNL